MARILSQRFTDPRTGHVYQVALDFDRIAALRENLSIGISAVRLPTDDAPGMELAATLNVDLAQGVIEIEIDGEVAGRISLNHGDFAARELDDSGDAPDYAEDVWHRLKDYLMSDHEGGPDALIEGAIQSLPVPDPVLGCLLKAGLSTTIGQAIRCHFEIRERETLARRARALARCLAANSGTMIGRIIRRTIRCALFAGLG
ncbi:MAG: hypothetical protein ABS87_03375 [Sphingomonas sp. SCN 67-18]|uniref:hypothetical protein n=1 Tax=uncultured Sphingomonas sp. TaxID=158754 RepID=UPI00086F0A3C|nr:hypothetical protein [Sphingomonas sp. SCN 67-18]ODU22090.1 MAG: hypothetical protein ABS87_03375 [Sphingomonas sp. SCN 67-18]